MIPTKINPFAINSPTNKPFFMLYHPCDGTVPYPTDVIDNIYYYKYFKYNIENLNILDDTYPESWTVNTYNGKTGSIISRLDDIIEYSSATYNDVEVGFPYAIKLSFDFLLLDNGGYIFLNEFRGGNLTLFADSQKLYFNELSGPSMEVFSDWLISPIEFNTWHNINVSIINPTREQNKVLFANISYDNGAVYSSLSYWQSRSKQTHLNIETGNFVIKDLRLVIEW